MGELTALVTLLGEKNVEIIRDEITKLLLVNIRNSLEDYEVGNLQPVFDDFIDKVFEEVLDKISKEIEPMLEGKIRKILAQKLLTGED